MVSSGSKRPSTPGCNDILVAQGVRHDSIRSFNQPVPQHRWGDSAGGWRSHRQRATDQLQSSSRQRFRSRWAIRRCRPALPIRTRRYRSGHPGAERPSSVLSQTAQASACSSRTNSAAKPRETPTRSEIVVVQALRRRLRPEGHLARGVTKAPIMSWRHGDEKRAAKHHASATEERVSARAKTRRRSSEELHASKMSRISARASVM